LNDVFEVADRIAVVHLGRMVAQGRASDFDRQSVVDYMTTGASRRAGQPMQGDGQNSGAR
jgi:ABC-type sugar transport system ATPase subunit